MNFPSLNEQMDLIRRGSFEILPEEELEKKIVRAQQTGKPLVIKLGCDPSRADLHLGHSVVLRKLAQFQSLGHTAVLIIGDFTGMIGDPSGRNTTRPSLTLEQTRENGKTYLEQAVKIIDGKTAQILYNSDWLGKMSFEDVIRLSSKYTVARMLERDDFTKRYKAGEPISLHEFLYPLAQGMDSVAIKSDVELGGTDQKFNLLVGRDLQREHGLEPQVILTVPLLVGTDGVDKMSKSYDNYIGINESSKDIYGKSLSIPDSLIYTYFELATNVTMEELRKIKQDLEDSSINPRNIKRTLARTLVAMYHSPEEAVKAEEEFDNIFIKKGVPEDIASFETTVNPIGIVDLIVEVGFAPSKSEARRLVQQGGVSLSGDKISDPSQNIFISEEQILKVGKRNFIKLTHNKS